MAAHRGTVAAHRRVEKKTVAALSIRLPGAGSYSMVKATSRARQLRSHVQQQLGEGLVERAVHVAAPPDGQERNRKTPVRAADGGLGEISPESARRWRW